MYRIDTTPEFDRDIKAIDKPTASRIINKIEWLSINPNVLKHPLKHMPSDLRGLQNIESAITEFSFGLTMVIRPSLYMALNTAEAYTKSFEF